MRRSVTLRFQGNTHLNALETFVFLMLDLHHRLTRVAVAFLRVYHLEVLTELVST